MLSFRHALSAPLLVLGAAATAFVAWIVYDARAPIAARPAPAPRPDASENTGPSHAIVLGVLRPGFPRMFAEQRLATLPPPIHEPVDVSGPTPVCRVRYHVHLLQPVPQWQNVPSGFAPGPYIATLEYDGGVVGQPLIRITIAPAPRN
jgi:hypothetical protein